MQQQIRTQTPKKNKPAASLIISWLIILGVYLLLRLVFVIFGFHLAPVGVNPQTAEVDACRMEHAVSDESFQKLKEHAMRGIAAQKIDNTFDNFPVKK